MTEKPGLTHQPDYLRGLAAQMRAEADRAEARADRLDRGAEKVSCQQGCWNLYSTCLVVQPL